MTDKFRRVDYQEIAPKLGSSCTAKDLSYCTQEEIDFRMEVREWAIREVLPYAEQVDRNSDKQLAIEIGKKTAKRGYCNQMIPVEWGGGGRNCVAELSVMEELAAPGWVIPGYMMPTHTFLALPIYVHGSDEMKRNIMMPLLQGEKVGGMALTEPGAGSNVAAIETTATRDGDDWILNGEKRFTGNGSTADFLLTYAVTNPDAKKSSERLTAFVIDTKTPGFEVVKDFELMGMGGMALSWLKYDNMRVPDANRLGPISGGFKVAMSELDPERASGGAGSIGSMRTAYEIAAKYVTEREQFGTQIGNHQATGFKLVDMYVKLETCRLLAWRCAKMVDMGLPASKESSALKLYVSEACVDVLGSAFQMIGGIAYTKDYPIERLIRDARVFTVFGGTSEVQRLIVSRTIMQEAREWPIG